MNSEEKEGRHQARSSAWCELQGGQGECWWWWRSAEWNWGEQSQAKVRRQGFRSNYIAEQPIHAEQRRKGREEKRLEWNTGAPNQGRGGDWGTPIIDEHCRQRRRHGALNAILKCQCRLRSADGDCGAPILVEEHHCGGKVWSSPPCVIDECSGVCRNTIYHCGRAKFASIFILRKHNCTLQSSGILRQHTIYSWGHKRWHLRCERLKELRCGQLSPHAIGGEENLMVDYVKDFHLHEQWFLTIDALRVRSIVKRELRNMDLKLSLWSQILQ